MEFIIKYLISFLMISTFLACILYVALADSEKGNYKFFFLKSLKEIVLPITLFIWFWLAMFDLGLLDFFETKL